MASQTARFPHHERHPILYISAPQRCGAFIGALEGRRPLFVCVAAHTETAEIDGLSAAGATPELRRLTGAADIEALFHGRPLCMEGVPSNPLGAPGPILITQAALTLGEIMTEAIDAGLRVKPRAPTRVLADAWGRSIETGRAVPHARELFEAGRRVGRELASRADYLVVGETVPGGTTTALAVLCGLGIDAWGKVSSSMRDNAHALKNRVVARALAAAGLDIPERVAERDPLGVFAAVGDPMQPVVAGMLIGAAHSVPIMLAGGTQMIAVLAVALAISRRMGVELDPGRVGVATTRWVAEDPTADLAGVASAVGDYPVVACDLNLAGSRHPGLRLYEQFLVKEGVGAGGATVAAMLWRGISTDALIDKIERIYESTHRSAALPTSVGC